MVNPAILPLFNSDLLIDDKSREHAYRRFGAAAWMVDHEALREWFIRYDAPANIAKRRSRSWGVVAVVLGLIALMIASGALVFHPTPDDPLALTVALWMNGIAVLFGIGSAVVGLFGVLFAGAKKTWLHSRMITERLRQFHYQHIIVHLTEAFEVVSDETVENRSCQVWAARRDAALERVTATLIRAPDAYMINLIGDGHEGRTIDDAKLVWVDEIEPLSSVNWPADAPHPPMALLDAYRDFRIRYQRDYAAQRIASASLKRQITVLRHGTLIAVLTVFLLHLLLAAVQMIDPHHISSTYMHLGIVWLAFIALAFRALDEGLMPDHEIARYRDYRLEMDSILARWDSATMINDKVALMIETERASFREMVSFLRAHADARFVM